ncbi:uncharacterized protein LOC134564864 isoform X3 [Prinia subflava]|uniref:uncharacterized protein LOC134564864 isoform X3 n=1 Tax=Prinia subflava TaxID=208062 RepID=UPI002FE1F752
MKGYMLFRRDTSGRCGGEVALFVKLRLECMEVCLGVDDKQVESLWVRIKGQTSKGDTVVGVCYRLPEQEEEVDEAFYRQLEAASQFQALVLVGDLNYPDICWRSNTAKHKQSRRFLESIDDNFLSQVVEDPTRNGVLLDLKLTNREGLIGDVKVGGSLGSSDHEIVEFSIRRRGSRAVIKITTLDFLRATLSLFRDLLGRIPWEQALQGRGVQENWLIFKNHFLQAQEQYIPMSKELGKGGKRLSWRNKELKHKQEVHRRWKQGQAVWNAYGKVVREGTNETRKAKAHLELNLTKDVKDNQKGFFNNKRKMKDNVRPFLNGGRP